MPKKALRRKTKKRIIPLLHWEGEHPNPYGTFDTVDGSEILQSPVEVGSLSH